MKLIVLIALLCACSCAYADIEAYYCVKASFKMKDGTKHEGYFAFATYEFGIDKTGCFYYDDGVRVPVPS